MRSIVSFVISTVALTWNIFLAQAHPHCEIKFLVTAPKTMLAGTTEKICVDLQNSSSVEILFELKNDDYYYGRGERPEQKLLAEALYAMNSERECFEFEVPKIEGQRQRSLLTFLARDMANPEEDFTCNKSKNVMILNDQLQTLIQTDKPIYKPGQPVKFRLMSIDKDFKPDTETIPLIYIETPNGIRLMQWENVETNRSLVDLEYPMTSEPLLGDWVIKAEFGDRTAETTFKVDEYVLPKFEISVSSTPSFFLLTDTSAEIRVCAKYTYGQPVRGTVNLEAIFTSYRKTRPVSSYEGETGSDGCYSFEMDLTVFELRSYKYSYWNSQLKVDVDITDSVTGESLTHSTEVGKLFQDALSISVSTASTFKPGIPFYGTVSVNNPDQTPAAGKGITLTVKSKEAGLGYAYNTIFEQNYTTPDNGVIQFTVPDVNINTTALTIRAKAYGYEDKNHASYTQYRIYDPFDHAYIKAQYSPSGSFVQVEPIREKLVPGSTQELHIFYTSDSSDADDIPFQFVFMSLGDVIDVPVSTPASRRRRQVENGDDEDDLNGNGEECEGDLVFSSCSTACPLICGQNVSTICTAQCIIGCVCPEGLYRDSFNGTSCMPAENCTQGGSSDEDEDSIYLRPDIFIYPPIPIPDPVEIAKPGHLHSIKRSFEVTRDMSPEASLLVYYIREDGEVVADSISFDVAEVFGNEVTLDFADSQVKPNGETSLDVTADPDSLCGVGVVDKSVYVLGGENTITKKSLFDSVRRYKLDRYGGGFYDSSSKCSSNTWPYRPYRRRRSSVFGGFGGPGFDDSSFAFKNIGLVYITNLDVETKPCEQYTYPTFPLSNVGGIPGAPVAVAFNVVDDENTVVEKIGEDEAGGAQVRSYFPETFLWDIVTTDVSGSASIPLQAPHTITDWIGNAFCLSPENGLGVAPSASLITFQPFFLTFSLPYSVIRGENVPITISVFNYLDACLVVRVTLDESDDFTLVSESNSQDVCVCGGQADSVEFRIIPLTLGQLPLQVNGLSVVDSDTLCGNEIVSEETGADDTVRRELLVKAEGVPEDFSWSRYFCLRDTPFKVYQDALTLPGFFAPNMVPDSASGKVIVTGDILGPSVDNLDHLIRLPTGCGEQNMLGFVPNIVVLEYLSASGQLTPEREEELKGNMRVGYQRELNYRHRDGSFSAFGESDESGNTWLTAFVVRSLAQASKFIYVDKADLNVSIAWLKDLQDPETGCIASVGRLGYKAMMGGVSGESMLTAYAVVTYLEAGLPSDDEGIVKGLECVIADIDSVEDNYALVQIAYALTLANRTEEANRVLDRFNANAKTASGLRFWPNNRPGSQSTWHRGASAESIAIEIASYAMLVEFLRLPEAEARQSTVDIMRWLIENRGRMGGFSSTQDTVMGLTALAKFAVRGDQKMDLNVEVRCYANGQKYGGRYSLFENNKRLQQEFPFDGRLQVVRMRAFGESGCALVQVVMNYNVKPTDPFQPSFTLKTSTDPLRSKKGVCNDYRITTSVSYNDESPDDESNMALVTVVPPSGFYPIKSSLKSLSERSPAVKRFEIDGEKINFYFDSLDSDVQVFDFDVTKEFAVEDVKPGYVTVTDYYEKTLTRSVELDLECDPDQEPIDPIDEIFSGVGPVILTVDDPEDDPVTDMIPPPPPPPREPMTVGPLDEEASDPSMEPVSSDSSATPAIPSSTEGTPFPGFGYRGEGKEEDVTESKPVEEVDDKMGSGQNKSETESKDGQQDGEQESTTGEEDGKEGDGEEGAGDKPAKSTDGTPEELKTDAIHEEPKDGEGPEDTDAGTEEPMITEVIYVEETDAAGTLATETAGASSTEAPKAPSNEIVVEPSTEAALAPSNETAAANETAPAPVTETQEAHSNETAAAPATETPEAPSNETAAAPATETPEAPSNETAAAPVTETPEVPSNETAAAPATETPEAPSNETAAAPATETPEAPSNETAAAPVTETPEVPSNETAAAPATETPEAPSNETAAPPATETPEAPSNETAAPPATETPEAPSNETAAPPATETPEAPSNETAAAPATDTPEAPSNETAAAPATKSAEAPATGATEIDVTQVTAEGTVIVTVDVIEQTEVITVEAETTSTEFVTEAPTTSEGPTDFNECTVENICPPGSECVNFPGTYECRCLPDFTEDAEGNCHGCAHCEDAVPDDGLERFCRSSFVYIVKRRRNDLRLLKEKRVTDELVKGRVARDFIISDDYCGECNLLSFGAVDRFILMANATREGDDVITIDQTTTILPFTGPVVNALDTWINQCP